MSSIIICRMRFGPPACLSQIGGKRRRRDIGKMLMLANCGDLICIESAHSNAVLERNHGMSSSLIFENYIVNRVVSFDQNQSSAARPILWHLDAMRFWPPTAAGDEPVASSGA